MSQINPLSGSILQSTQVQHAQATEKDRQTRRAQNLSKNVALQDDELEHQVESSDQVSAVPARREDEQQSGQRRRPPQVPLDGEDEAPRVDLTA